MEEVSLHDGSKRHRSCAAATVLFAVVLATQEQEKTIQRSDLPPAVEKTVLEQSKWATIRGFCLEKENAQTFYEAVLIVNGKSKNVRVDVNGSVVEMEEPVSIESLPAAVSSGFNGTKSEVQVGPDGKPLDREE